MLISNPWIMTNSDNVRVEQKEFTFSPLKDGSGLFQSDIALNPIPYMLIISFIHTSYNSFNVILKQSDDNSVLNQLNNRFIIQLENSIFAFYYKDNKITTNFYESRRPTVNGLAFYI